MRLKYAHAVVADIRDAYAWRRANDLPVTALRAELARARKVLSTTPFQGPPTMAVGRRNTRRLFLQGISSFLYFEVREAEGEVDVLRLLHTSLPLPKTL